MITFERFILKKNKIRGKCNLLETEIICHLMVKNGGNFARLISQNVKGGIFPALNPYDAVPLIRTMSFYSEKPLAMMMLLSLMVFS